MKYLAFDLEAANAFQLSSVCSFGYVVADENFEIERQQNLLINPRSKYNLNGTRSNIEINLQLDKEILSKSPDFAERYSEIRKLLTGKDTIVVGHAVESDVRMLNAALRRYKLPPIDFEFVCSQLIFKHYRDDSEVRSLSKIADELKLEFVPHAADEDARISLLTLKHISEESGLTLQQLLDRYAIRKGKTENFELTRSICTVPAICKRKVSKEAVERIVKQIGRLRRENKKKFKASQGAVVALSRMLELNEGEELDAVLKKLVLSGGQYTSKISKCNVYIYRAKDETEDGDDMRQKHLEMLASNGKTIQMISTDDYLADN